MRKIILKRFMLVTFIAVLISGCISVAILQEYRQKEIIEDMKQLCLSVADLTERIDDYGVLHGELGEMFGNYRVTIVAAGGTVLFDSIADVTQMENHAQRQEVKEAFAEGFSQVTRSSGTLSNRMIYIARRTDKNEVVRISMSLAGFSRNLLQLLPASIIGLLFAMVAALFLSKRLSASVTNPITQICERINNIGSQEYGEPLEECSYDELSPLIRQVNTLKLNIDRSISSLLAEKEKTQYLLNNMAQGLIVLDADQRVVTVNRMALRIFERDINVVGKNVANLLGSPSILKAIEKAKTEQKASFFDLDRHMQQGEIYEVHVTPVSEEWMGTDETKDVHSGVTILLTDITQQRQSEKMRAEFVANASHELKTPITSIKGFAELLSSGMVEDLEKREEYLSRIMSESQRINLLIDDILKLSYLESNHSRAQAVDIDLNELAKSVAQNLAPQAEKQQISIEITGDPVVYHACEDDMIRLLINLMENAVKYNKKGGSVWVNISREDSAVKIRVKDTGIGIPQEDIPRIFERFYRVDKGRSRNLGGTGLGLSIVKHIVAAYNGTITLHTQQGVGTQITITLG